MWDMIRCTVENNTVTLPYTFDTDYRSADYRVHFDDDVQTFKTSIKLNIEKSDIDNLKSTSTLNIRFHS